VPYIPIEINRKKLSISGVNFGSVNKFDDTVSASGTVIYKGFYITPKSIEIIHDYLTNKITLGQLILLTREKPIHNKCEYVIC